MAAELPRAMGSDDRGAEFSIDIGVGADTAAAGFVAWVVVRRLPQMQVLLHEEVRPGGRPWHRADEALAAAYDRGRRRVFLELSRSRPPPRTPTPTPAD